MKANETKRQLITRFTELRTAIGPDWRSQLSKSDKFFDTKLGADDMVRAAAAVKDHRRIGVDRITRIVKSMETLKKNYQAV